MACRLRPNLRGEGGPDRTDRLNTNPHNKHKKYQSLGTRNPNLICGLIEWRSERSIETLLPITFRFRRKRATFQNRERLRFFLPAAFSGLFQRRTFHNPVDDQGFIDEPLEIGGKYYVLTKFPSP